MRTWSSSSAAFVLVVVSAMLVFVPSVFSSARDYDLSEDSVLPPDDGSGPDDEDMSDLFTGVISGDTLRCYKCTGVTQQSGCNVTSFRQNLEDYVTKCSGHCLNISTADSTVFDCTEDVQAKAAKCFQTDGMQMCVCNMDLCNGPPSGLADVIELPASQQELTITSKRDKNTKNVTSPETSKQRQNNDTYIEATEISGGDRVKISTGLLLLVESLWFFSMPQGHGL